MKLDRDFCLVINFEKLKELPFPGVMLEERMLRIIKYWDQGLLVEGFYVRKSNNKFNNYSISNI